MFGGTNSGLAPPSQGVFGPSGNQPFSSMMSPGNQAIAAPMANPQGGQYGHAMGSPMMPPPPMPMPPMGGAEGGMGAPQPGAPPQPGMGAPGTPPGAPPGEDFNSRLMNALGGGQQPPTPTA